MHLGRKRTFEHVEGNFPTNIIIPFPVSAETREMISSLLNVVSDGPANIFEVPPATYWPISTTLHANELSVRVSIQLPVTASYMFVSMSRSRRGRPSLTCTQLPRLLGRRATSFTSA